MDLKERLIKRFLEIPINHKCFTERSRLAKDLDVDVQRLDYFLRELCINEVIKENKEYKCLSCGKIIIMSKETKDKIVQIINNLEDFVCEKCSNRVSCSKSLTGNIYYDIVSKEPLLNYIIMLG